MGKIEPADLKAHVDDIDKIVQACALMAKALWGEFWSVLRKAQPLGDVKRAMAKVPPSIIDTIGIYEQHVADTAARHAGVLQFVATMDLGAGSAVRELVNLASDIVRHHELGYFADVGAFVDGMPVLRRRVLREAAKLSVTAAAANSKPARKRHATSLDERACELMKRWQRDDAKRDRWTIDELAGALESKRPNLIGKQRGHRRCPKFFEEWNLLLAAREEAKRLPEVPRARPRPRA